MSGKIILVDVDITVCPSDMGWLEWLQYHSGMNYSPFEDESVEVVDYDLSTYFKDCLKYSLCPYDFWRDENLYDGMAPLEGSVETLEHLHNIGYKIAFLSQLKGGHHKSKFEWLKKYFPFLSGFIGTKEKWLARGDVLIDDRHSHLASMSEGVRLVKIDSPYTQDIPLQREHLMYNWDMGVDKLLQYLEGG